MLKLLLRGLRFIFFLSITLTAQITSEWEVLQSPTNDILRKLYFVDAHTGWATGLSGTIVYTSDAGNSWITQNSNVITPIVDIYFINKNVGWALTYSSAPPFGTTILYTTSGGSVWSSVDSLFPNKFMSCIYFADNNTGWIGGNGIYKTTNGGLSWYECSMDSGAYSNYPIYDFNFFNKDFGYACGGRVDVAGVIWKTTNAGESWSSLALSPDQIFDIYIKDSLNAIALSGDPELLFGVGKITTNDGGITWQSEELPIFGVAYSIDFLNENEGFSSAGFQILKTGDGGITWVSETVVDSLIIYDLQFVDKYTGFACGENGALLRFTSFKKPTVQNITLGWINNYPNPFSDRTKIEFTVLSPDFDIPTKAKLTLYDILGNKVAALYEDEFRWGYYSFEFSPNKQNLLLSSGVYILTLSSGDTFISKKILYLK